MPLVGGFGCLELCLYGKRELASAQQYLGFDLYIEVANVAALLLPAMVHI